MTDTVLNVPDSPIEPPPRDSTVFELAIRQTQNQQTDSSIDQTLITTQGSGGTGDDGEDPPHLSNSQSDDSPGKNESTAFSEPVFQWYFKEAELESSSSVKQLELVRENQAPVMFGIKTQRIEWEIPEEDIPEGSYELVLGVSSESLDINAVDSISFDIVYGNKEDSDRPSEVLPHSTLKDFFGINKAGGDTSIDGDPAPAESVDDSIDTDTLVLSSIQRWRLHENIVVKSATKRVSSDKATRIIMTAETWNDTAVDLGVIILHFLEIRQNSFKAHRNDATYKQHHPFTWSIDVNSHVPFDASKEIVSYCFSGDYAYAALLTHSNTGQHLEIYQIEHGCPNSPQVFTRQLSSTKEIVLDISVSWNGSQVVVLDLTPPGLGEEQRDKYQRLSAIYYRHRRLNSILTSTNAASGSSQEQFTRGQLYPRIKDYHGRGMFYASVSENQDIENELFITFDGITLTMYRAFESWSFFREFTMVEPEQGFEETFDVYPHWKEHLRGGRLVLPNEDRGYVSTWFLWKTDARTVAMDMPTAISDDPYLTTCLSAHGSLFAMAGKRHVDLYLTETWTRLGTWWLPNDEATEEDILHVRFMSEYRCIMVNTHSNLDPSSRSYGFLVNINTMTTVGRINCRGLHHSGNTLDSTGGPTSILLHETRTMLKAIRHTDRLVRSSFRPASRCTDLCTPKNVSLAASLPGFRAEVVERTIGPRDRREKMFMLTVTASNADGTLLKTTSIPLPKETRFLGLSSTSFDDHSYLVVVMSTLILVWRFPASLDGDYDLLLAEGVETDAAEDAKTDGAEEVKIEATEDTKTDTTEDTKTNTTEGSKERTKWSICRHQQLYRFDSLTNTFSTRNLLDPHQYHSRAFLSGLSRLTEMYKDADDLSQQAILRYVERHTNINQCLDPKEADTIPKDSKAIPKDPNTIQTESLRENIDRNLYTIVNQRLEPKDDPTAVLNRLCHSWTMESHECLLVFIKALLARPSFRWVPTRDKGREASPIAILLDHLEYHFIVIDIIEVVVHYCIRQAKVDNDPRFLDPVFLSLRPALRLRDIDHGIFSRTVRSFAYFPARDYHFAMDHHTVARLPTPRLPFKTYRPKMLHERKNPVLHLTRRTFDIFSDEHDNERFTPHLYVASFDMLWSIEDIPSPKQFSLAILLWLLLTVTFTNRRRYICHFFKLEDLDNPALIALIRFKWKKFGFTFWLIETSPIMSSIRLMFAFRVMKTVGGFLSIVKQAVRSTWVFVAMFGCIIVLFSIAFLDVQYTICIDENCSNIPNSGPPNFFVSTALTYFMTGGMYNLVDDNIKAGNWMVHFLLATFLFLVMMMLNVLFGLVNHAFDNNDRISKLEWIENRMYLVMRAENTLHSLGWFKNRGWFPERIYYTANPQDVRDYRLETQSLGDKAASASLPLDHDRQGDESASNDDPAHKTPTGPSDMASTGQFVSQQLWMDRLKEDMRAEIKEELKEQLEAQKKQSAEQIEQLQAQLNDILTVLRNRGG
ncbi:hypothetical protein BGX23_008860 [Mortierella sp. AD031]|nr:hypothetical protein BGX23_008860 [Mortierella sp. AD031]